MRIILSIMVFFLSSTLCWAKSVPHDFSNDISEVGKSNFDIDYHYKKNSHTLVSQGNNLFTYYVYNDVLFYVNYFLNRQMNVGGKMYYTSYKSSNLPAEKVVLSFYSSAAQMLTGLKLPDLKKEQYFVARTADNKIDFIFLMFTSREVTTLVCIVKDRRFIVPESEPMMRYNQGFSDNPVTPGSIKSDADVDAVIQGLLKKYGQ